MDRSERAREAEPGRRRAAARHAASTSRMLTTRERAQRGGKRHPVAEEQQRASPQADAAIIANSDQRNGPAGTIRKSRPEPIIRMTGTATSATMRSKATLVSATCSGMKRRQLPYPHGIAADGGRKHLVEELPDIDVRRPPLAKGSRRRASAAMMRQRCAWTSGSSDCSSQTSADAAASRRRRAASRRLGQLHPADQPVEERRGDENLGRRAEGGRRDRSASAPAERTAPPTAGSSAPRLIAAPGSRTAPRRPAAGSRAREAAAAP